MFIATVSTDAFAIFGLTSDTTEEPSDLLPKMVNEQAKQFHKSILFRVVKVRADNRLGKFLQYRNNFGSRTRRAIVSKRVTEPKPFANGVVERRERTDDEISRNFNRVSLIGSDKLPGRKLPGLAKPILDALVLNKLLRCRRFCVLIQVVI